MKASSAVNAQADTSALAFSFMDRTQEPCEIFLPDPLINGNHVQRSKRPVHASRRAADAFVQRRIAIGGHNVNIADHRLYVVTQEAERRRDVWPVRFRRRSEALS